MRTTARTTIRRRTKRFEQVLQEAKNVTCYSLSNGFVGSPMREDDPDLIMPPRDWLRRELDRFDFARLLHGAGNRYILHVHGNLWYEFEVES